MEFTYEGLVRQGFGFYNPNHAAALIVLLLPGLWLLRRMLLRWIHPTVWRTATQCACLLLEAGLYAALIWTFSRAGLLALIVSALVWWGLAGDPELKKRWVWLKRGGMILLFAGMAIWAGAGQRFTATSGKTNVAASNRVDVWKGGLRMLADNPGGVGAEMSGQVYTLFYNPNERTSYRTMVNSWLTLATERGLFATGIAAGILLAELIGLLLAWRAGRSAGSATKRLVPAAQLTALGGILISASTSTCFDLNILLHPTGNYYGPLNDWLQFGLALLCVLVVITSALYGFWLVSCKGIVLMVGCLGGITVVGILFGGGQLLNAYAREGGVRAVKDDRGMIWACSGMRADSLTILPDTPEQIKELLAFARTTYPDASYRIALRSVSRCPMIETGAGRVLLSGSNCSYAQRLPANRLILYKPTLFLSDLPNIERIYLPKWDTTGLNTDWKQGYPNSVIEVP